MVATTRSGLLTRDNKLILVSVLLNSIPYGYMNVVPLVYLLQVGYNPGTIGAIYSAGSVASAVGLIPFGILADRVGRKPFVILGSFLPSISYAIFGLTLNPYLLTIAAVIGGVGFGGGIAVGMSNPSFFPLIVGSTSDEKRTTIFALVEGAWVSSQSIGSVLSFLPALLILSFRQNIAAAHSEAYFLMSGLMVISTVPLLFVHEIRIRERRKSNGPQMGPVQYSAAAQLVPQERERDGARPRMGSLGASMSGIVKFAVIYAMAGLGVGALVQVLPTWYNLRFGVSETEVGTWMAIAQLLSLIALPIIPRIARRGTVTASAGMGIAGAFFLVLMPLSGGFETAALFFIIRSICWAISWPVLQSYMMGVVAEDQRATASGIAFASFVGVMSIGTFAGEAVLGAGLMLLPFILGIAGYLFSSVALEVFFRKIKPPEEA